MQSNGLRTLLAVVAIVILVGGFLILTGEDEAGEGSGDPPSSPSRTGESGTPKIDEGLTGLGSNPAKEMPTTVVVAGGAPEGGVAKLEYEAGDRITFAVESDAADEIHVHGYDIEQEVGPGKPAEFDFAAELDGIYEVELHGSETQIAELVVNP